MAHSLKKTNNGTYTSAGLSMGHFFVPSIGIATKLVIRSASYHVPPIALKDPRLTRPTTMVDELRPEGAFCADCRVATRT